MQFLSSVPSIETILFRITGLSSTYVPGNTFIVSFVNATDEAPFIVLFGWFSARPVLSSSPFIETNIVLPTGLYDWTSTLPFPGTWVSKISIPIPGTIWVTIPLRVSPLPK